LSEEILYQMMDKLSSIETRIDGIDRRIDNMESNMATKDDIAHLHSKFDIMSSDLRRMGSELDASFVKVAHLSEIETAVKQLSVKVKENTADIKLLKKLVSSF
jgi:uncharacterized protein YoxC